MLPVAKQVVAFGAGVFFDGIGTRVVGIIVVGVLYKHNLALTAAGYSKNTLN